MAVVDVDAVLVHERRVAALPGRDAAAAAAEENSRVGDPEGAEAWGVLVSVLLVPRRRASAQLAIWWAFASTCARRWSHTVEEVGLPSDHTAVHVRVAEFSDIHLHTNQSESFTPSIFANRLTVS